MLTWRCRQADIVAIINNTGDKLSLVLTLKDAVNNSFLLRYLPWLSSVNDTIFPIELFKNITAFTGYSISSFVSLYIRISFDKFYHAALSKVKPNLV
jgi:hypothetical protein